MRRNQKEKNTQQDEEKTQAVSVCAAVPHPLQTVMQLHGFEEMVLLVLQAAAHVLTNCSELAAFGLD